MGSTHSKRKKCKACCSLRPKVQQDKLDAKVISVMGALIQSTQEFQNYINTHLEWNTTLCISGELKSEGKTASNYRYTPQTSILAPKEIQEKHENVVDNYMWLFHQMNQSYKRPIYVVTIPRKWRLYTFHFHKDGSIQTTNENKEEDKSMNKLLYQFLESFDIGPSRMQKLRVSCQGAGYRSYLIDMVSFFYEMYSTDTNYTDIFTLEVKTPAKTKDGDTYQMYFQDSKKEKGYNFYTPKKRSVGFIYENFKHALSLQENYIHKNIRGYCLEHKIHRWSDFDANDIDDALTILMILNAFKVKQEPLTSQERHYINHIKDDMESWFLQFSDYGI